MDMIIGYTGVALFLLLVVGTIERYGKKEQSFSEYATGGRSYGSFLGTMTFINSYIPGTVFISSAGLVASAGVLGYFFVPYTLLAIVLMLFLARPVFEWGARFDLRTQADLLGLRYNSSAVRVTASVIGLISSLPWIVLGMQSLTLVFSFLSFGQVGALAAVIISIAVIAFRQIWTVRYGMRGVIIGDLVQGIFAYLVGTVIAVGLVVWLLTHGHGFSEINPAMFTLPGVGSALGPLYTVSIILTGALATWCWPDIFVRLFSAKSAKTVQRTALQSAPVLLIFGTAVTIVALLASSLPEVAAAPDNVWFITASVGGIGVVTLAAISVVGASLGNVGANLQALGAQTSNDIVGVIQRRRVESPTTAKIAVAVITLLCAGGAFATASTTAGLVTLALISYQGIVQLAPTVFLGIFWKRGTATAALASMIVGFVAAVLLTWIYPVSIPWLGGLTSGLLAMAISTVVYVGCSLAMPGTAEQRDRVERLWQARKAVQQIPVESELVTETT